MRGVALAPLLLLSLPTGLKSAPKGLAPVRMTRLLLIRCETSCPSVVIPMKWGHYAESAEARREFEEPAATDSEGLETNLGVLGRARLGRFQGAIAQAFCPWFRADVKPVNKNHGRSEA
jgi:hypothetical protein